MSRFAGLFLALLAFAPLGLSGCAGESPWSQPAKPASAQSKPMASTAPAAVPSAVAPSVKVALLLPLSGKNAALGQAMLQAAQLAVFDMGQSRL